MRRLGLAMLVALAACDDGGWRVEVTGPRVGFSEWRRPCTETRQAETPADLVRRGFEARIRAQRIVKPAPLNCILGLYSDKELRAYAGSGDPAAALALIYKDFLDSKDTCATLQRYEAELLRIADEPYMAPEGRDLGYRISLLPDALAIVAEGRGICGGDENQAFVLAWEKGLDIQTINGGVIRPH